MKSIACASILALFLLGLTIPHKTTAAGSGPSANGTFQLSIDGQPKTIEFDVRTDSSGNTAGEMTFSGQTELSDQDLDGDGSLGSSGQTEFEIKANFDCLSINGNRAVMSGVVTGATFNNLQGQRLLLVVEDNGEGVKASEPDRFTWGIYSTVTQSWVPVDAEREDDIGASLTWIAKDAEREDDPGIPSNKSTIISCQSFPVSSYSLVDLNHGDGNIQVKP